ncbi:hypothetical protein FNO25_002961 [Vibrio fluvialis]|uniref:hypothetical protein n=1 Tax=Vibrio fluvialis TaxID=676 RepID=UPI001558ED62|nr:hypothetical protein [Vibrio fluvialis]EKO3405929.1 hypothetical protein [Vibrio fluvialis]EKO3953687.1 hypothetical protein [Vibrio fluvialis]EKO3974966.1 hypothetical protein [Vibrio fluvialis]EKO4001418.1 hypothetical protein [Vibrio fluvialis]ELG2044070.1 hypothetical protein [Vibrio fluvialis]
MRKTIGYFLNTNSTLVQVYTKLVVIENALKDFAPFFSHDVPKKLISFGQSKGKVSFYSVQSNVIGNSLAKIKVNAKPRSVNNITNWFENPISAPRHSYPFIRYARFQSDYTANYTVEADLNALNVHLDKVLYELKMDGKI